MKKCLSYLALLLVVLFIADRILAYSLDAVINQSDFRYVNLKKESPDFYVVGNSRAVYAVWESKFDENYDLDVLNISFTRLNSESIRFLTKSVPKDKQLFIEISSFLSQDPKENGVISPIFKSIKSLRKQEDMVKNDFSELFKSYNFNNRITLRLIYHLLESDKEWVQKREINTAILAKLKETSPHELFLKEQFFDYLKFLNDNDYNYVFFHSPYHPLVRDKISNINEVHGQLDSLLGNQFLDLSDLLTEDVYFADGIHTNYHATDRIHKEIYDRIQLIQIQD